jgi:hypothetical protein
MEEQYYMNNPNLPRRGAKFEYTPEQISDLQRASQDIIYFAENFFYIIEPGEGRRKIKLHDCQKKALKLFENHRFTITCASRQVGKSTLMTIFALWIACFKLDQRILLVANKEATAIEIFRRVRLAYEELPNWLKPTVKEYGKTSAEFDNGSRIGITTTTSSAGRGSSCDLLILDELAHIEAHLMKEFWAAVYPIISASKKSKILIASTPNGTDNLFYQLWSGAEKGENGWEPLRIHWSEIPGRDAEWARITKSSLESEDLWAQEFELVFHSAGQSAINFEQFEQFKMRLCEPDLVLDDGVYKVYKSPDPERVYVAGIDIAEGIGQDFSVIQVLDITDLQCIEQVAEYAANDISPYNFITKVKEVLAHYGNPLALIERNGPGAQIIDKLVNEEHYENIVSYGAGKANRAREQLGMISHTNTKYQAITNMRYWMNDLDSMRIYSKDCLNEFKHFVRKPNKSWSAESGHHDDRVMSMAWALMILHNDIVLKYFEVVDSDTNGKPRVIKPLEYGLKYFSNPNSIYTLSDKNNEHIGMPVVFNNSIEDTDIGDLDAMGWELFQY